MPNKLIKDGTIIDNKWQYIAPSENDEAITLPSTDHIVIPFSTWLAQPELISGEGTYGIHVYPGDDISQFEGKLEQFTLVAIHFPAFADGRGYSYARTIREQFKFDGEIRATGDVLRDQISYLYRSGFNAFEVREDKDLNDALNGLKDFSMNYQADIHQADPIYRRR